jgi:4-amino-4-deoxy-L-arabinose transferase-like glycosyltransferase
MNLPTKKKVWRTFGVAMASPALILTIAFALRSCLLPIYLHQVDMSAVAARLGDCTESCNIARSIADGKGFSSPFSVETGPTAWVSPVYPYLLAGIFKVFGTASYRSIVAAAILNEVFFLGLTCLPVFFIAKHIGGPRLGAIAAWLWALYPIAVPPLSFLSYIPLSTLLTAVTLWATLAICDSDRRLAWIGYGICWGLGLLTNPSVISVLPFFFIWLVWMRRKKVRQWVQLEALAALAVVLVCTPWIVRNYILFHQFVPLRSNFGIVLFIENHEEFPRREVSVDTEWVNKSRNLGEVAFSRGRGRQAIQFMVRHPGIELRLVWGRFLQTWLSTGHPFGDFIAYTALSSLVRLVLYAGLSFVALLGLLLLYRENLEVALALGALPIIFPLIYYVSISSVQYRLPIDPAIVVLAAFALFRVTRSPATGANTE